MHVHRWTSLEPRIEHEGMNFKCQRELCLDLCAFKAIETMFALYIPCIHGSLELAHYRPCADPF